jgi:hypothetical protein
VSKHLLRSLQDSDEDLFWNDDPDLLVWMLYLGGSFSARGPIRSAYKQLLQSNYESRRFVQRHGSPADVIEVMRQFIWSDKSYRSQFEEFWTEVHPGTRIG